MPLRYVALQAAARLSLGSTALATLVALTACGGGGGGGEPVSAATAAAPAPVAAAPATPAPAAADPRATAMAAALASGDSSPVSLDVALQASVAVLQAQRSQRTALRQALFGAAGGVTGLDWNPSHDSVTFNVLDPGRNPVLLAGNWRYKGSDAASGAPLAVAGLDPTTGARYAAFGGNPLAVRGNAAMDAMLRNTVAWLTGRSALSGLRVVAAHLPGRATHWFPHETATRSWLAEQLPGVVVNGQAGSLAQADDACDASRLAGCLNGADLLVIGRQQGAEGAGDNFPAGSDAAMVLDAVKAAQARGTPVLYLHHYRDTNALASGLLGHFGLGVDNNYWANEGLKALDPATQAVDPQAEALLALLQRLQANSFSTTFSGCVMQTGKNNCSADTALNTEFLAPATALRSRLRALDAQAVALFDTPGYAAEKHLVLLGDKLREGVRYPLDKQAQRDAFFRAHFSDMAAYLNRRHSSTAANQGSFAAAIPAATPTVSRLVTATAPTTGTLEVLTGLYAMPGRSITLTRTDTTAASVSVGLNMLRDSTRVYNTNGYDRPSLLGSPRVALAPGRSITLTSPFGGPVLLFVASAANSPSVVVQADGATTHPVLHDMRNAAQVAAFKAELASTPTQWVGVATEALTLHSSLAHFRRTLADHGDDLTLLAERMDTYMVRDTFDLAGFSGPRSSLPAAVQAFCTRAGWDCTGPQHRRDVMQHVIADTVATCGAGCSGNPYDQSWALDPLGWGETHEIGHNLQRERFNIYGGQSGEVSNNIFPVHKQMAYNRATAPASPVLARAGSTREVFAVLKAGLQAGASPRHVYDTVWANPDYAANNSARLNFYRQLVEFARHYNGGFADGWELYTLLHLMERNYSSDTTRDGWAAARDAIGFSTYASRPASISGNDFMLIACSHIIGRDMRPVFALWGVDVGAAAAAQVAAFGQPAAEALLFPMAQLNAFGAGVGAPVRMAADASYPGGF